MPRNERGRRVKGTLAGRARGRPHLPGTGTAPGALYVFARIVARIDHASRGR
jgi:hypothetical protein